MTEIDNDTEVEDMPDVTDEEIASAELSATDFDAYLNQQRAWDDEELEMSEQELNQAESHEKLLGFIDRKGEFTSPDSVELDTRESSNPSVAYEEKTIRVDGMDVTGKFPVFDSACDVDMPEEYRYASVARQETYCNRALQGDFQENPDKYADLTPQQRADIAEGRKPAGFTWHHNEEVGENLGGRMQLVDARVHAENRHDGGFALHGANKR